MGDHELSATCWKTVKTNGIKTGELPTTGMSTYILNGLHATGGEGLWKQVFTCWDAGNISGFGRMFLQCSYQKHSIHISHVTSTFAL